VIGVKNGDWIMIDYTGRRASDSRMVETTSEEVAKKEGAYDEKIRYEPNLVILGQETTLKGLEEALMDMKVGESRKLELAPEKAFGARDPSLVRVMPIGEFRKRDINPAPGMVVELDRQRALVKSVTSGRVTIDLNHLLAGERLSYELKLVEVLKEPAKRAKALMDMGMRVKGKTEATSISLKDGVLEVHFKEGLVKDMNFIVGKTEFVSNALRFMPEVKRIRVVEDYTRKE
jgi:peptidylprolyl isomerase